MNRGSEWNIWDLHIHTPETAKNNHLNWLEFFNMKEFTEWLSKQ